MVLSFAARVTLTLAHDGKEYTQTVEEGDGPIASSLLGRRTHHWLESGLQRLSRAQRYTRSRCAGDVQVEIEYEGQTIKGVGVSTDTVESTILAMLNAINRIASVKSSGARLAPN